jgi:hypothetical protein
MADVKWSEFDDVGNFKPGNTLVGLSELASNLNARFTGVPLINGGYQDFNLASGNVSITNPVPTYIDLFGQPDGSRTATLPLVDTPISFNIGDTFWVRNSGNFPVTLLDNNASIIATIPAQMIIPVTVQDITGFGQFLVGIGQGVTLSQEQSFLQITGLQTPPLWFQPTNTSGAVAGQSSFGSGANYPYLQFPDAVISYSYAIALLPKRWNQSTFQLLAQWYTPATTGTAVFKADAAITQLGSSLDLTFGSAVSASSPAAGTANAPTNVLMPAITPSGTASDNSWIVIRFYRDGTDGSDSLTNNAFIINPVEIQWTSSQGNDS